MKSSDLIIVDYQMGNLRSVQKALEHVGFNAKVTSDPDEVVAAEKVILPGVGAFADAMHELQRRHLTAAVIDVIRSGKPFLGICLGLQLLFEIGFEGKQSTKPQAEDDSCGTPDPVADPGQITATPTTQVAQAASSGHRGLGVLSGTVERFSNMDQLKVPHMGWNQIAIAKPDCPLLKGIAAEAYFYFVHSYYVLPADRDCVWLECDYGFPFCAAVWQDNLFATQFHPEKSQGDGLQMLKNFAQL